MTTPKAKLPAPTHLLHFRARSSLILCGLSRIATVITDEGIEDREAKMLETAGVTLIVARKSAASREESSLQA